MERLHWDRRERGLEEGKRGHDSHLLLREKREGGGVFSLQRGNLVEKERKISTIKRKEEGKDFRAGGRG